MSRHLSREQLVAYRAGSVSPAELLRLDDHLESCPECRLSLGASLEAAAFIDRELTREHLTEDQLDAWAGGRPIAAEAIEHLDSCPECRGHAEDLRTFIRANPARPASRAAISVWYLAAAAAVLAALGVAFWKPAPAPQPEIIAKAEIPVVFQRQIDAALQSGELSIPAVIAAMPTEQLRLRAAEVKPPVFHVVSPLSTAAISDRPTFRWTELQGARFQVFIYDDAFREVMHSESLDGTEWKPSQPLARSGSYRWEVRATVGAQSVSAPVPPDPDAVFLVVPAETAGSIAAARAALADNPLGLGIVYANAGAIEEARTALAESKDEAAAGLLQKLPRQIGSQR